MIGTTETSSNVRKTQDAGLKARRYKKTGVGEWVGIVRTWGAAVLRPYEDGIAQEPLFAGGAQSGAPRNWNRASLRRLRSQCGKRFGERGLLAR